MTEGAQNRGGYTKFLPRTLAPQLTLLTLSWEGARNARNLVEYGAALHWSTPTKEPPGNQNSCHFLTPGPEVTWVALRGGGACHSIYDVDTCMKCMMMMMMI